MSEPEFKIRVATTDLSELMPPLPVDDEQASQSAFDAAVMIGTLPDTTETREAWKRGRQMLLQDLWAEGTLMGPGIVHFKFGETTRDGPVITSWERTRDRKTIDEP